MMKAPRCGKETIVAAILYWELGLCMTTQHSQFQSFIEIMIVKLLYIWKVGVCIYYIFSKMFVCTQHVCTWVR